MSRGDFDIIKTRRLIVRDNNETFRVIFTVSQDGGAAVVLSRTGQTSRSIFGCLQDDSSGLSLSLDDEKDRVAIDITGDGRAGLRAFHDNESEWLEVMSGGGTATSHICAWDRNGRLTLRLR